MTHPVPTGRGYALALAEDAAAAPTLYLYDILGTDLFGGIAARQVVEDLRALGEVPALDVRVNSPGGDVFEGIAVYNSLVRFPAKVTVHVDGIAASIASLIATAGDQTVVAENAMFMVHRPWTVVAGDADAMRQQAETLDKAWGAMLTTYSRRTGRRPATIERRVAGAGGEWWMSAEDAVAEGFADEVAQPTKQAAVFGLGRFQKVPARLAARATDDDAGPLVLPTLPCVAEIEPPRIERPALDGEIEPQPDATAPEVLAAAAARRRRIVEVLRVTG